MLVSLLCLHSCTNEIDKPDANPEYYYDEDYFLTSKDTVLTGQVEDLTPFGAKIRGRFNLSSTDIKSSWKWGVVLSESDDPQLAQSDSKTFYSKVKSPFFWTAVSGLQPATRYYYRTFLHLSNSTVQLGRVMYFTTPGISVSTSSAESVTPDKATIGGTASFNVSGSDFQGSLGVLVTARQTDRPNLQVDKIYECSPVDDVVDTLSFNVCIPNLDEGTKYLYQAFVLVDSTYYWGSVCSFTTGRIVICTDEVVDLGLTVRWATRNVGASSPELAGSYFGWGEKTGTVFSQTLSDYAGVSNISGTKYDMATANEGDGYQVPTWDQFQELLKQCNWKRTTYKNVVGYAVTGPNGNSMFMPSAGYTINGSDFIGNDGAQAVGLYWTGTRDDIRTDYAYNLELGESEPSMQRSLRYTGMTVRPVIP